MQRTAARLVESSEGGIDVDQVVQTSLTPAMQLTQLLEQFGNTALATHGMSKHGHVPDNIQTYSA
jgi:hypothetical protein